MSMATRPYRVCAALQEESKDGWVWLSASSEISGGFIRITNPQTKRCVVCEARMIDDNFRALYNSRPRTADLPESGDLIVMNWAYRDRLGGIATQAETSLDIVEVKCWWQRWLTANLHHPHAAVRVGIISNLVSVALGALGFLLGISSMVVRCGGGR